jgi:predicted phage baseplate assembly protein
MAVSAGALTLELSAPPSFPVPNGTTVLVQDVNGNGASATVTGTTSIQIAAPVPVLVPPLQVLYNLLNVTRGKTVTNEVLGSGNALVAGQDFTLQNSPVTYLTDPRSISGYQYSSTVSVWVNQVQWSEVQSFYGQPPGAQVFITREDEQGQTHVVFGDGQNGARLPTGVNNVVASYRYGSGAAAPAAGSLTVVLKPQPGLRSILNPVAVGGGGDPDPADDVRQRAPLSVTTFGRAISLDDFQIIAAQTPGVTRAKAAIAFDPLAQRPRVTVWVGDDGNAVTAAQQAFAASADPNRQPRVVLAQAVQMTLSLTVVYDPTYDGPTVQSAVQTALIDPDAGLLGVNVVGIGEVFYDSQIYAACLAVPGVVAVHSLDFQITNTYLSPIYTPYQPIIRERLEAIDTLAIALRVAPQVTAAPTTCCGQRHDPGSDAYLLLQNDSGSFNISLEEAS